MVINSNEHNSMEVVVMNNNTCSVVHYYTSPNIVRVLKSRKMRWAGHVALMGEKRGAYRFLVGKPEGKRPL